MDPIVTASLVSGGVNLLGGLLGFGSNDRANETNLKIAQMNNEWNERMLDKQLAYNQDMFDQQVAYDQKKMQQQNDFTEYMWNEQNKYNDPSAQMSRMRQAKINPYMALGNISSGSATSSNSSGSGGSPSAQGISTPQAQQVQVQPYDWQGAFSAVANTVAQYYQFRQMEANTANQVEDAKGKAIDNRYRAVLNAREAAKLLAETKYLNANERKALIEVMWQPRMFQSQLNEQSSRITLNNAMVAFQRTQTALAKANLKWVDAQMVAQLANIAADTSLKYGQRKAAIASALESEARKRGIQLNNDIIDRATENIVTKYKYDAKKSIQDAAAAATQNDIMNAWLPYVGTSNYGFDMRIGPVGFSYSPSKNH